MPDITVALGTFKALYDSAKALKDMNDAAVRNGAVIELQEKILAAQASQLSLLTRISELEEKVRGFEAWDAEKERYELRDLGFGALAYMLKPAMRGTEPPHWICTNCYGKRHASIIQYTMIHGSGYRHVCPSCKTQINPSPAALSGDSAKWLE